MRLIYISGEPTIPSHHYRVARPIEAAARLGVHAAWMGPDEIAGRADEIEAADVVVVWRAPWDEPVVSAVKAARKRGAKIVFDLDDLLIEPDCARPEVIAWVRSQPVADWARGWFGRMRQTMLAADLCVAPTAGLAAFMRRAGQPTIVLPNGFDHSVLAVSRIAARQRAALPSDGWMRVGYAAGTPTHRRDFSRCVGAVAEVLKRHPKCLLVLFRDPDSNDPLLDADDYPELRGLEAQIEWRRAVPLAALPFEIARFDINLAPLEVGNPYCESKSELKYFEAALVDVPTVASPTGPFRGAIRHGETGYLASSQGEWREILTGLLGDSERRARIAAAARRDVLWTFGPERRCGMVRELLDYLEGGPSAARAFQGYARPAPLPQPPQVPEHDILFNIDHLRSARVTVVVALHGSVQFVGEALESVARQTLPDLDLIVVDDHSTNGSLLPVLEWASANAERFNRISVLRNRADSGRALTLNAGFDAADTPFVLPLDADDRLLPGCAAACLSAVEASDAVFAYPVIRLFGESAGIVGTLPFDPVRLSQGNYIDGMALIAKAAWSGVGGYDHACAIWEDFDLWCSFAERGLRGVQVPGGPRAEKRAHGAATLEACRAAPEKPCLMLNRLEERHPWLDMRTLAATAAPGATASQTGHDGV